MFYKKTGIYRKFALRIAVLAVAAPILSGCIVALPPAVQAASLALDGISFAATGKTVSDHALSAVTEQDCAMSRALSGENICTQDAQMAELENLERRLDQPDAQQIAQRIVPAGADAEFQNAALGLDGLYYDTDEILDGNLAEEPQLPTGVWPVF